MTAADVTRAVLPIVFDDGAEVRATSFAPQRAYATVVCLPALGVPASYYEPLAKALVSRNLAAVTADLRGLGLSSVRPRRGVDFGYRRLVDDAAVVVSEVRQHLARPVYLLGHSLGGHIGAILAGTRPNALDGLLLVACGTPYWRRFALSTGLSVLGLAYTTRVLGTLLGYVPGRHIGFGGIEAAHLMREWGRLARRGRFEVSGIDAEAALAAVDVPTLVVSVEGDWMAPESAVGHLAGKLARTSVERARVTADGTDPRALDHFKWARYPDAVADVVARWLEATARLRR